MFSVGADTTRVHWLNKQSNATEIKSVFIQRITTQMKRGSFICFFRFNPASTFCENRRNQAFFAIIHRYNRSCRSRREYVGEILQCD